ncbi:MAG: hypothetical protein AB1746_00275 [Candidatus Zixiibacteriota bacterium]
MKRFLFPIFILVLLASAALADEAFVNWRADYYVMHPDDWYHVPYRTVNIFLESQEVSMTEFDFDAVLAKRLDQKPFFEGPYIFLTHIPMGKLNRTQIDSVLNLIEKANDRKVVEASLKQDHKFNLNQPIYDADLKLVAVKSRVTSEYVDKILLEFTKFYDNGIAYFLCYSPKEMYEDARPTFISILNSFETRDIDKMAKKDSVKVVDLSEREPAGYNEGDYKGPRDKDSGGSWQRYIFILLLLIIVIGLVKIFVFKKKKQD